MIQIPPEQINARWDELAPEVRDFILSDELIESISNILTANNLIFGAEDSVQNAVEFYLEGFLSPESLLSEMINIVGNEKAKIITDALLLAIPDNIRALVSGVVSVASALPAPEIAEASPTPVPDVSGEASYSSTPAFSPMPVSSEFPQTPAFEPAPMNTPETSNAFSDSPNPPAPSAPANPVPVNNPPVAPAPFILHQEEEIRSVSETQKTVSSPLRPSFYAPSVEEMREEKPAVARLQFGFSAPFSEPPASSASPKITTPGIIKTTIESDEKTVPTDNVVNLRDLPL